MLVTPASLCRRRSSKPKIGAGRTMVVSGKILRTTSSPRAWVMRCQRMRKKVRMNIHLSTEEFRRGVLVGIVGRDMNESIDIVLSNRFGNALCAFHMNILKIEVSI